MTRRWTRVALVAMCAILGSSFVYQGPSAIAEPATNTVDARQQLDELEQQQQDLAAQKAASQEKLAAAQNQLTTTRTQITEQKKQMEGLQAQISQIALQQYQDRGLNTTAMIMTSNSSDDLLNYITAMQQVTDTANTLFASLQIEQGTLEDLERSEEAAVAAISEEQANLDSLEKDVRAKVAKASALLNSMIATAAAQSGSLAGINAQGAGVADPRAAVPNPSPRLVSPLDNYSVSSPFGMRIHPIDGTYTFHDGLDMSSSCGTPVTAPANGFVIDYNWGGGYGNRLVLDNGIIGGHHIVTSYNHLSAGVAKPGASVIQGQVIALVGSTGASTGCHLHFMVWSDGELLDPASFIR